MAGFAWIFEQEGGDRKKLILNDYAAPFGRPRQKAIFKEKFKQRIVTKRYPGNSGRPTRHLLGTQWDDDPVVLTGRWMDKTFNDGTTSAKELVETWQDFVGDQQRCTIAWGSILSFIGFVESIEIDWESDTEVAWTMNILVDERKSGNQVRIPTRPRAAPLDAELIDASLRDVGKRLTAMEPDITTDIFDALDSLFSTVAGFTSQLVKIANEINNIENQTFMTLQRLRLALHEVKTAMNTFQMAFESIPDDAALFSRQAGSDIRMGQFRAESRLDYLVIMDTIAEMDRSAAIQQRGRTRTAHQARMGDTWESISNKLYGAPDGADKLRKANGVKYGQQPIAGKSYIVPK